MTSHPRRQYLKTASTDTVILVPEHPISSDQTACYLYIVVVVTARLTLQLPEHYTSFKDIYSVGSTFIASVTMDIF
jgi:hypothetical protein